jgi:hypothetical protein
MAQEHRVDCRKKKQRSNSYCNSSEEIWHLLCAPIMMPVNLLMPVPRTIDN